MSNPEQLEDVVLTNSKTSATIRTAIPTLWSTIIMWLAVRFGWTVTPDDILVFAPVFAALTAIVYRLFRYLEGRWPVLSLILLGSSNQPLYVDKEATEVLPQASDTKTYPNLF